MNKNFEILLKSRRLILKVIEGLSIEQLNKTPDGFKNNIAWNIAHLVVTQQLLCYKLAGLKCLIADEMIANFQKGTSPMYVISEAEFANIKSQFLELPKKLEEDFKNGIFKNYNNYTTSVDVTLTDVNEAIAFNTLHEGIHLGIILQLKKFV